MGQADRWLQPEQPGDPDAETKRLDDLSWCDVLDTPPEEAFDRITRTAKFALDVPMALVSLVDRDRQWFKSRQGLAAPETPREISFCTHAIQRGDVFVVTDSWIDPRFRDNPLVTGMPFIRAYAGQPLTTPRGVRIGTLCVLDTAPRRFSPAQLSTLADLACLVTDELELRQVATKDSLTGALRRRTFYERASGQVEQARRYARSLSFVSLDIDHFKAINDRFGHQAGDAILQEVGKLVRTEIRAVDLFARVGGEEFVLALPETDAQAAAILAERLRLILETACVDRENPSLCVTASFGVAELRSEDRTVDDVLKRADQALCRAKAAGRNLVRIAGCHVAAPPDASLRRQDRARQADVL